jgi:hypothetical protein
LAKILSAETCSPSMIISGSGNQIIWPPSLLPSWLPRSSSGAGCQAPWRCPTRGPPRPSAADAWRYEMNHVCICWCYVMYTFEVWMTACKVVMCHVADIHTYYEIDFVDINLTKPNQTKPNQTKPKATNAKLDITYCM